MFRILLLRNGSPRTVLPFLLAFFLLVLPAGVLARVVISELLWSGSYLSTADEWVELQNTGTGAVSLSGWTLVRVTSGQEIPMITFGSGDQIHTGQTFLIANYPEPSSRLNIEPDLVTSALSLPNTQLLLRLYAEGWTATGSSAVLMDQIDDGIGAPFAGSNGGNGAGTSAWKASMERIDLSGSGSLRANWRTATTFINFDDGARIFGTPRAPNGSGFLEDVFPPQEATDFHAETNQTMTETDSSDLCILGSLSLCFFESLSLSWTPSSSLDLHEQILTYDHMIANGTGMVLPASETGVTFIIDDFQTASGETLSMTGITFTLRSIDESGNVNDGVTTVSAPAPNIRITEVLANPAGADDNEWIEIANFGLEPIDLAGWTLDDSGTSAPYSFSQSASVLLPLEHRVFSKKVTGISLTNSGEELFLRRGQRVMDSLLYEETAEEVSYGLLSSRAETRDDKDAFTSFCVPTPGKPNTAIPQEPRIDVQAGATQGVTHLSLNLQAVVLTGSIAHAQCSWMYPDGWTSQSCNPPSHTINIPGDHTITLRFENFCGETAEQTLDISIQAGGGTSTSANTDTPGPSGDDSCTPQASSGIRINEFIPNPTGGDAENEFIELLNTTDTMMNLCGWKIDDTDGGSTPYKLDGRTIAPRGLLLLPREQTKIAINNSNEQIRLFAPDGSLTEAIAFENSKEGNSYALRDDGIFLWTPFPTPGMPNRFRTVERQHPNDTVVIAGVLPNPDGADEGNEWVDIMNVSDHAINLAGWMIDNRDGGSAPFVIGSLLLQPRQMRRFLQTETGITFTNTADNARLLDSDGLLVSLVSWTNAVSGLVYEPHDPGERTSVQVAEIIDGDTIDVLMEGEKIRVRLIGVDTPETVHPRKAVEKLGKEASAFTKKMLEGKRVTLAFDENRTDKYGRMLAYVLLADGTNFNGELIRRGFSPAYLRFPFALADLFAAYEQEARAAKIGLWADAEVAAFAEALINDAEEERIFEEEGLILTVEPRGGIVASGTIVTLTTNIAAMIFVATGSTTIPAANDTVIITANTVLHAYAQTGSGTRSNEIHETYLLERATYETPVIINEVMSAPATGSGEWIELMNPTGSAALLGGWKLDDEQNGGSKPFTLPADTVIPAYGFGVFTGGMTKLTLNNDGDMVVLLDPTGSGHDVVMLPKMKKGTVYAKTGTGWCISVQPTPGEENICVSAPEKQSSKKTKTPPLRAAEEARKSSQKTTNKPKTTNQKLQTPDPIDFIGSVFRPTFASGSLAQPSNEMDPLLTQLRQNTISHLDLPWHPEPWRRMLNHLHPLNLLVLLFPILFLTALTKPKQTMNSCSNLTI